MYQVAGYRRLIPQGTVSPIIVVIGDVDVQGFLESLWGIDLVDQECQCLVGERLDEGFHLAIGLGVVRKQSTDVLLHAEL